MLRQFSSLAAELENNRAIEVTKAVFNPPATEEELKSARGRFDLTPAMIDFYGQANGVRIEWERRGEKRLPAGGLAAGRINLLPVQEVFGDWEGVIFFDDNRRFELLHPLDFFAPEACAALRLDGSGNPEVFYHYLGEEMNPLGVDFEGYLELLLRARGFWYWQRAVARPDHVNPRAPMSVEERNFRELMPQLFPDFDPSDFRRLGDGRGA